MAFILVIDDDLQLRATVVAILGEAKHEVLDVGDGNAGIRLSRARSPDVVLTDIIMPEQEGIETILHFRKLMPDVKIIAMSGGGRIGSPDFLPIARQLGAHLALRKPFRAAELISAVSSVLSDPRKSPAPVS
jgi:CheY-like chemotaxis protein